MANKRTKTEQLIDRFTLELQNHISVSKVILFGSQRRSQAKKWSDIDLAVISIDFKRMSPFERMVLLGKIAWKAKTTRIEAFGYTPQEYNHASSFDFIYEIKRTGKILRVA